MRERDTSNKNVCCRGYALGLSHLFHELKCPGRENSCDDIPGPCGSYSSVCILAGRSFDMCAYAVCMHLCELFAHFRGFASSPRALEVIQLLSLRLESLLGKRLISLVLVVQIAARRRNFPHPPP